MTDVLLIYEHRTREIENCALIACELEKRGYKVKLKNIYSPFKYFIKPKVVVVPHLYDDQQLIAFAKNWWRSNKCIIDLQYEQLLANNIPIDDVHNPKGQAMFAHHIAWGQAQVDRYLACGIDAGNIHKTGAISMDLLRDEFCDYFFTKRQLGEKYQIDPEKKWVLFVSSFSLVNRSDAEIQKYQEKDHNSRLFADLSERSYKYVLEWLRKAASMYPNYIFIYRPHPAEKTDIQLSQIVKDSENIVCIGELSMRQWAKVADKIYNWYSTSMADIYFTRKPCGLVRPIELPKDLDIDIFDGMQHIATEEDFLYSIDDHSPLPKEVAIAIENNYGDGKSRMAYLQIVDLCEEFILGITKGFDYQYGSRWNMSNTKSIFHFVFDYLKTIGYIICVLFRISHIPLMNEKWNKKIELYKADIYEVNKIFEAYKKRFEKMV